MPYIFEENPRRHISQGPQEEEKSVNPLRAESPLISYQEGISSGEEDLEPWDTFPILGEHEGMRMDALLATLRPMHSRTRWQEWIQGGYIFLGEQVVQRSNHRVVAGTLCRIAPLPEARPCDLTPCPMDIGVHYEDEDLLVIEKPAGLVVHPGAGTHEPTLIHGLLAQCTHLSGIGGVQKPGLVHRLDKDTSGLMLVAKNDGSHQGLSQQFAQRSLEKKYLAFVHGQPCPPFGRLETLLGRDSRHRLKQAVVTTGGREAITTYRTLETKGDVSLLECGLLTGRTHQIRVHCAHMKHPLLGDALYGHGRGHHRQALHAHRVRFSHPRTGQEMAFTSPLPEDLQKMWEALA